MKKQPEGGEYIFRKCLFLGWNISYKHHTFSAEQCGVSVFPIQRMESTFRDLRQVCVLLWEATGTAGRCFCQPQNETNEDMLRSSFMLNINEEETGKGAELKMILPWWVQSSIFRAERILKC